MKLFLCQFIIVILLASLLAAERESDLLKYGSNLFFGKLWSFKEYCGYYREDLDVLRDDVEIQALVNGTYLELIHSAGNVVEQLNKLNYLSIKAKQLLPIICSANSWGYADEFIENLANIPFENGTECLLYMDRLSAISSQYLATKNNLCQPEKIITRLNSTIEFDLTYWLQFNSFGRVPSGVLLNNHLWLGDYDECMRLSSTRYCLGSYGLPSLSNNTKPNVNGFRIGLCLPRSCTSRSLLQSKKHMDKLDELIKYNLIGAFGLTDKQKFQLVDLYCPPANDSAYRQLMGDFLSIILLSMAFVWVLMLLYGTFGPLKSDHKSSIIKNVFDLRQIWSNFFLESDHISPELAGLNGVKVIAMNWLMITHIYLLFNSYIINLQDTRDNSILRAFVIQGQHGVPIFFLISGILVGHKYLSKKNNNGVKVNSIYRIILLRYVRLLPMYLLIYTFVKKFYHLIGSGPLWDHGVSVQSEQRQCILESWLVPVLMLSNFISPFSHCVVTGWHVANDFQIYLILPLLLLAYKRSRVWATTIVIVTFLGSHLSHVYQWGTANNYAFQQIAAEPFLFGGRLVVDRLVYDYVNPLGRIGTYFLGVLLADLLFNSNSSSGQFNFKWYRRSILRFNDLPPASSRMSKHQDAAGHPSAMTSRDRCSMQPGEGNKQHSHDDGTTMTTGHHHHHHLGYSSPIQNRQANVVSAAKSNTTNNEDCQQRATSIQIEESFPFFLLKLFKDNFLLIAGLSLTVGTLLLMISPLPVRQAFGPYSKAISYPLCRCLVELGWAALLYSLLNGHGGGGQRSSAQGNDDHDGSRKEATTRTRTIMIINNNNCNDRTAQQASFFFLKMPIWNILVKLNYALMLTHFTIARYIVQSQRQLLLFTWANLFQVGTFFIFSSYLFSLLVHITIETPMTKLIRLLVTRILFDKQAGAG